MSSIGSSDRPFSQPRREPQLTLEQRVELLEAELAQLRAEFDAWMEAVRHRVGDHR